VNVPTILSQLDVEGGRVWFFRRPLLDGAKSTGSGSIPKRR
jgi:hypothetical protein